MSTSRMRRPKHLSGDYLYCVKFLIQNMKPPICLRMVKRLFMRMYAPLLLCRKMSALHDRGLVGLKIAYRLAGFRAGS